MPVKPNASTSTQVAAHLLPACAFDTACELVVRYLSDVAPMGMWAVTRIASGRQVVLATDGDAYPITHGAEVDYAGSMCRWMVSGTAPRIAPDVSAVPEDAAAAAQAPIEISSYIGTPIVQPDGELFGTVCGFDPHRKPVSLTEHRPLLDLLPSLLSAVLESDLRATAIARELEQARREAEVDALTGLLNRRGWDRYLRHEEQRFRRFGDPACVVVLDLDHLKIVDDTQGHEAGDHYIQRAATVLAGTVRKGDVLARLGGDEFGVVAVGATPEQAGELVARAERAMAAAGVAGSFGHARTASSPASPAPGRPRTRRCTNRSGDGGATARGTARTGWSPVARCRTRAAGPAPAGVGVDRCAGPGACQAGAGRGGPVVGFTRRSTASAAASSPATPAQSRAGSEREESTAPVTHERVAASRSACSQSRQACVSRSTTSRANDASPCSCR
ncbi:MAG: diguanylate cyclase with sensor [Pseudonocardia sp.]|uniref:sensor domain-containing diguanylate cyclase n=1 Tax=Pseudonocardia sp. TaxID=60912 RepID=UPI00260FA2DE|nr:sensor domain-containing diguanylate cyclase [Pseudonocardia sp.]MCU1625183.1 diguanylate cyclase with sensor [Pseudonocardia sp.]